MTKKANKHINHRPLHSCRSAKGEPESSSSQLRASTSRKSVKGKSKLSCMSVQGESESSCESRASLS